MGSYPTYKGLTLFFLIFNNSSKILFFLIIMVRSLITVSANSWLGAWIGLEINLLSFIPLIRDNNNLMTSEASLKYFLTQALTSSVLLFALILFIIERNFLFKGLLNFPSLIITSALLMKRGAAPFHLWFPLVIEGLSWTNATILITWQKLAPLIIISYLNEVKFIEICVILCVVVGRLGGLNQISFRKLLAYSSIGHLGWILISITAREMLWLNYYTFYVFLSLAIVIILYFLNLNLIPQLFNISFHSESLKFILFLNILSLGGLPPFIGFFPKWMTIQHLSLNRQFLIIIVLVMFSLVTLFFYLRIGYSAFVIGHTERNWKFSFPLRRNLFNWSVRISFFSSIGLIIIRLFFWLY